MNDITYKGPEVSKDILWNNLPSFFHEIFLKQNGFIVDNGAFHFRGFCTEPKWHSLQVVWKGEHSFSKSYDKINIDDIPFGQDGFGDQYFLRENDVILLSAETGDVEKIEMDLPSFYSIVQTDWKKIISWNPDLKLEPGRLLFAYPPFCVKEANRNVSLKDVPAFELYSFHAELAKQISKLKDGEKIKIEVTP